VLSFSSVTSVTLPPIMVYCLELPPGDEPSQTVTLMTEQKYIPLFVLQNRVLSFQSVTTVTLPLLPSPFGKHPSGLVPPRRPCGLPQPYGHREHHCKRSVAPQAIPGPSTGITGLCPFPPHFGSLLGHPRTVHSNTKLLIPTRSLGLQTFSFQTGQIYVNSARRVRYYIPA
jgi:hypothetical protein